MKKEANKMAAAKEKEPKDTAEATNENKLAVYVGEQEKLLIVDEVNLNEDIIHQPARFTRAAINYHKAERQLQREKQNLDTLISMKDAEIRAGEVKTTESYIDKTIKGDADVQAQRRRIADAELQVGIHQSIMRGWDHKRDMLIQMGASIRADMAGQLQINKSHPDQERPQRTKNGRATEL